MCLLLPRSGKVEHVGLSKGAFYDTVYADAETESFISGESLAERLSVLGACKNAGNTSLDLVNEAQEI